MIKMSKEFKVGLLFLIGGVILYFGFNFLKGKGMFSSVNTYYVVYDKIDGLTTSNPIKVNGFGVGRVNDIIILQEQGGKIQLELDIDKNLRLNDSTVAVLASDGVLGGKYIDLKIKNGAKTKENKETILGEHEFSITNTLIDKASPMLNNVDVTMAHLNALLIEYRSLGANMKNVMVNVERLTGNTDQLVVDNQLKIKELTTNMSKLSASLVETEKEIKPTLQKLQLFADSLNRTPLPATVANANRSLTELNKALTAINQSKGSAGKLIYSDSLYTNLNNTVVNLNKLFEDMKTNPSRYLQFSVFGKKTVMLSK